MKLGATLLLIDIQRGYIHFADSISVVLDDGCCIVGDLEPIEYLDAYGHNPVLQADWELIMSYKPKTIYYAHVNEKN